MAFELPAIRKAVRAVLKNRADFLLPTDIDESIQTAMKQLSKDRALQKVVDIAGDGTRDYDLGSDFQKGFSTIKTVEHPAGENPPVFRREDDDWFIYEDPTKPAGKQLRLRFKLTQPTSTEIIRVIIFKPFTVTKATSDLDQTAFLAVVYKALQLLFEALASLFSQVNEPTITADSTDRAALAQNFLFLSERYGTKYKQAIGIGEDVKAEQAFSDADIIFTHGEDFLWHPKATR